MGLKCITHVARSHGQAIRSHIFAIQSEIVRVFISFSFYIPSVVILFVHTTAEPGNELQNIIIT